MSTGRAKGRIGLENAVFAAKTVQSALLFRKTMGWRQKRPAPGMPGPVGSLGGLFRGLDSFLVLDG